MNFLGLNPCFRGSFQGNANLVPCQGHLPSKWRTRIQCARHNHCTITVSWKCWCHPHLQTRKLRSRERKSQLKMLVLGPIEATFNQWWMRIGWENAPSILTCLLEITLRHVLHFLPAFPCGISLSVPTVGPGLISHPLLTSMASPILLSVNSTWYPYPCSPSHTVLVLLCVASRIWQKWWYVTSEIRL